MKKQILKNILSNYTARGLGLFLSFLLVLFLISKLRTSAFGVGGFGLQIDFGQSVEYTRVLIS